MESIYGKGNLYDVGEKQIMANVKYEICFTPPTDYRLGEWNGSFVLEANNVVSLGEYILIFQDNRKGKILISRMEMQSDTTIYYEFQGSGPLK